MGGFSSVGIPAQRLRRHPEVRALRCTCTAGRASKDGNTVIVRRHPSRTSLRYGASEIVGWAKALFAPCPPFYNRHGGHASLCPPYGSESSMAFEIVERFAAALAAPQRLAGSRAEF